MRRGASASSGRRRRRIARATFALASALASSSGGARTAFAAAPEHARVTFAYSRPADRADCADGDAVARNIAVRLGYDPFVAAGDARLSIRLRLEGRLLEASIRVEKNGAPVVERTRTSASGDCVELVEVAALTASSLIDPYAVFAGRKEGTTVPGASLDAGRVLIPPASERTAAEPGPAATSSALPSAGVPQGDRLRLGARTLLCLGCAPAANVGFLAFAGVERERWGLDIGGRLDLPVESVASDRTGVAASLLVVEAFPHRTVGPARLGPVVAAGTLSGRSVGIESGARDNSFWMALGARAAIELPVTKALALVACGDVAVVPTRVRLVVRDVERWSSGLIAATASLGALVAF